VSLLDTDLDEDGVIAFLGSSIRAGAPWELLLLFFVVPAATGNLDIEETRFSEDIPELDLDCLEAEVIGTTFSWL